MAHPARQTINESSNLPARRAEITQSEPVEMVGRIIDPPRFLALPERETLTVVVTDYAGRSPEQAAADVYGYWAARFPGCPIQVIHPLPGEIRRSRGRVYWGDTELVAS